MKLQRINLTNNQISIAVKQNKYSPNLSVSFGCNQNNIKKLAKMADNAVIKKFSFTEILTSTFKKIFNIGNNLTNSSDKNTHNLKSTQSLHTDKNLQTEIFNYQNEVIRAEIQKISFEKKFASQKKVRESYENAVSLEDELNKLKEKNAAQYIISSNIKKTEAATADANKLMKEYCNQYPEFANIAKTKESINKENDITKEHFNKLLKQNDIDMANKDLSEAEKKLQSALKKANKNSFKSWFGGILDYKF